MQLLKQQNIISLDIYTPLLWNDWELLRTSHGPNLGAADFKDYAASKCS